MDRLSSQNNRLTNFRLIKNLEHRSNYGQNIIWNTSGKLRITRKKYILTTENKTIENYGSS